MNGAILMDHNIDTPPNLEPSSDGVPQWLVLHITQIKSLVKTNFTAIVNVKDEVAEMKRGQNKMRESLARTDQKIESHAQYHRDAPIVRERPIPHNPSGNPSGNPTGVTFKWVADWGMKALFLFVGGIATMILKLVYDVLAN